LDSPGLQASLSATAKEFEDKGKFSIALESSLQNYPLTPNEEIHILHIVREALSNVLRHSEASKATISLGHNQATGMIEVQIADNGRGFTTPTPGDNHYGQTIMRERADILAGVVKFSNASEGGAEVILRFTAAHALSRITDRNKLIEPEARTT
jgi:two-component system nitrate/nitrite sensor histidine kinase NarX